MYNKLFRMNHACENFSCMATTCEAKNYPILFIGAPHSSASNERIGSDHQKA